jgi:serine/threonine protein kinase
MWIKWIFNLFMDILIFF